MSEIIKLRDINNDTDYCHVNLLFFMFKLFWVHFSDALVHVCSCIVLQPIIVIMDTTFVIDTRVGTRCVSEQ